VATFHIYQLGTSEKKLISESVAAFHIYQLGTSEKKLISESVAAFHSYQLGLLRKILSMNLWQFPIVNFILWSYFFLKSGALSPNNCNFVLQIFLRWKQY
jgi:hypothetical protein